MFLNNITRGKIILIATMVICSQVICGLWRDGCTEETSSLAIKPQQSGVGSIQSCSEGSLKSRKI